MDFLLHLKGSFTYDNIKKMCLAEFFEWQKIAIDIQKEDDKREEKRLKRLNQ